jgi:peptide/nickel transport system permease protein
VSSGSAVLGPVRVTLRDHPVVRFVIRRAAFAVLTLFVVSVLIFAGTQVLPGDAARLILGRSASPQALEALRTQLYLNHSVVAQYWHWLSHVLQGDLGRSATGIGPAGGGATVASVIGGPLANSAVLAAVTVVVLVPLSLALGIFLATRSGRAVDHAVSVLTLGLISLPEFVTASLLIAIFASWLGVLPPVSLIGPGASPLSSPNILVLPVLTLLAATLAQVVRMVRATMVEALRSDYVMAARLGGVSERRVLWRYALRNALAPTIQVMALNVQWLVGGIVITETVFGYPGLGNLLVQAVNLRDVPTVQSVALLLAVVYIALNILADLAVTYLIPKLRTAQ